MLNGLNHSVISEDMQSIIGEDLPWNNLKGKTVLITGANGFLPAYMVETLLFLNSTRQLNCRVIGLVRNISKAQTRFRQFLCRKDFLLVCGDISQDVDWPERCDFIIHAASQASPKFYGVDPVGTMTANISGVHQLLNHARKWESEGFLFFSSGEVYGRVSPEKVPTKEDDFGYINITDTRSCYSESKRAAETLGISYAHQYGVQFKIVRPFHTYGPGMSLDDGRVFADFVNDVVSRRNLVLSSDGKAIRSFCYLSDAVAGFFTVLLKGQQATAYNVGNPAGAMSIIDLATLLAGLYPELELCVAQKIKKVDGYVPSTISINVPDIARIQELGWSPSTMPREGFMRTIRYFKELKSST
jgi:UDP-glucuronate decarboxylase